MPAQLVANQAVTTLNNAITIAGPVTIIQTGSVWSWPENTMAIFTALGVIIALYAVWFQNRASNKLMRTQLALQFIDQYESKGMCGVRSEIARKLLNYPKCTKIDNTLLVFFEHLAFLYRTEQVDKKIIWNIFSYDIPHYRRVLAHYIEKEQNIEPLLYEEFVNMSERILPEDEKKLKGLSYLGTRFKPFTVNKGTVLDFLKTEIHKKGIN